VDKLKPPGKSFDISKWEVWEAYRQVKANQGAPGVDGVTLEQFDEDLKDNLYRIWNRLSSGSYFPPPVKAALAKDPDYLRTLASIYQAMDRGVDAERTQKPSTDDGADDAQDNIHHGAVAAARHDLARGPTCDQTNYYPPDQTCKHASLLALRILRCHRNDRAPINGREEIMAAG